MTKYDPILDGDRHYYNLHLLKHLVVKRVSAEIKKVLPALEDVK